MTKSKQDIFSLFLVSIIWASAYLFIKIADANISPLYLMFWRGISTVLTLVIIAKAMGYSLRHKCLCLKSQLIFATNGLCIAFMWYAMAKTEQVLNVGMSSFLLTSLVVFSWLIGTFFTKEKDFHWLNLVGIIVALFGMVVMLGFDEIFTRNHKLWYALLYIVGLLVFAIGVALNKHKGPKIHSVVSISHSIAYSTVFLLITALIFESHAPENYTRLTVISVISIGVICSGLGYYLYFKLVHEAGQVFASLNGYLVPVFGFLLGLIFLGENAQWHQIIGLLIVFLGAYVTNYSKKPTINIK